VYPLFERPVLFTISVRNFYGFRGFRLNTPQFSAFPQEKEFVLMDGTQFYVLKVEETVIENDNEGFEDFNARYMTLIHLYYHC